MDGAYRIRPESGTMADMEYAADGHGLQIAAGWLREGGVLIYPTETFYGLGADPRQPAAVEALLALKGRAPGHALPLVAGERVQVGAVAPGWESSSAACALADRFWPGPLSLVLGACAGLAKGVAAEDASIAIRWSAHPVAAALARTLGFPLIATSANRSGQPPHTSARDAAAAFAQDSVPRAGMQAPHILDGGITAGGLASTLVLPGPGESRVLREGAIPRDQIQKVLAGTGTSLKPDRP